ncbi:ATPase-AAA-core domain-containing protein [Mycena venus]|uniref:ATPase-AAA-core domain-containing protein n=1 Tax=Mycena venus TaxID=2733690 RepID=A0A8H7D8C8_9AGAR|nr:ATPase-AAA-core domain-containing protein [Mycena venus]
MAPKSPMSPHPDVTQTRLANIIASLTTAVHTLEVLASELRTPALSGVSNVIRSLLISVETVKQNKSDCIQLMEQIQKLLYATISVHLSADSAGELPPSVLNAIGKFAETLHKVFTFVEAQHESGRIKRFFRQGEMSILLKECYLGLDQALDSFKVVSSSYRRGVTDTSLQIHGVDFLTELANIDQDAQGQHEAVLELIATFSDSQYSDRGSSFNTIFSDSSQSMSMLPSQPKIFYGRESELTEILLSFHQETPRIAILGAGGMGKTSLARAVLHHEDIVTRFGDRRVFVSCDAATQVELVALLGASIGLKPGRDLTQAVVQHFAEAPPSLLVLDNLETLWEPVETRAEIEDFLSLLTDVEHLSLIVTMRGAERPSKVRWTRPFLPSLAPLSPEAARLTFMDISDWDDGDDIDKILALTDNMPLAVTLLAHLAELESCDNVLSRWEREKTSLVSDGHDKISNLELSISLSLSSSRISSIPEAQDLLSLLAMLPDGLSEVELLQSKLPFNNILGYKTALLRTALGYLTDQNRLTTLVPIREYMRKFHPPADHMIMPMVMYYQDLLGVYKTYFGTTSLPSIAARISLNFLNMQSILLNSLQPGHPSLSTTVHCICKLNEFSRLTRRVTIHLMDRIPGALPQPPDYQLEGYYITEMLHSLTWYSPAVVDRLVDRVLQHFDDFNEPDVQCRLYQQLGAYYVSYKHDIAEANKFQESSLSLAIATNNQKRQFYALEHLAWNKWHLGDYAAAQAHALEGQRLATISGYLYGEAKALHVLSLCSRTHGDFARALAQCTRARQLLELCGMAGGGVDQDLASAQAEVHRLKSEYAEARAIHARALETMSLERDAYYYRFTLFNIAEVDVPLGAPANEILAKVNLVSDWSFRGRNPLLGNCAYVLADLYIRERKFDDAEAHLSRCLKESWGRDAECVTIALEKIADISRWHASHPHERWTTVFLAYALRSGQKLAIHKALQFLGDSYLFQEDQDTAHSLFTVALEGFAAMEVHQSRAECLLRLGEISRERGDHTKARELWTLAQPLFERSSLMKQVTNLETRLAEMP